MMESSKYKVYDIISQNKILPKISSSPHNTFLKLEEKSDIYEKAINNVSYYSNKFIEDEKKRKENFNKYELNSYHLKKIEELLQEKRYNQPYKHNQYYYQDNDYNFSPRDESENNMYYSPKMSPRTSPRFIRSRSQSPRQYELIQTFSDYEPYRQSGYISEGISPRLYAGLDTSNNFDIPEDFNGISPRVSPRGISSYTSYPFDSGQKYNEYLPSPSISPKRICVSEPDSTLSSGSLKKFWDDMDNDVNNNNNNPIKPPRINVNTSPRNDLPSLTPTAYQLQSIQTQNCSDQQKKDLKRQLFSSPTSKTEELRLICSLEKSGKLSNIEAEECKKKLYTRQ